MRKILSYQENFIDDIILNIADKLNPIFKKLCFTPNILTTFSMLFGILSIYMIIS